MEHCYGIRDRVVLQIWDANDKTEEAGYTVSDKVVLALQIMKNSKPSVAGRISVELI